MPLRHLFAPAFILAALAAGLVPLVWFVWGQGGMAVPDAYVWRVLRFTLVQASLSTVLSVVPGLFVARALARRSFAGRGLLLALFAVPLALPVIVAVFGLAVLYGANGWLGGWFNFYGLNGILLAHVFFNLPLAARMGLEALDRATPESHRLAAQLGLRGLAFFCHVDWPVLRPALPRMAALVFLLCAASFVVVLVLGGPAATTLEVAIYQSLRMDFDVSRALTLSMIQVALSLVMAVAAASAISASHQGASLRMRVERFDGQSLASRLGDGFWILAATALVVPVLLALVADGLRHVALTAALWRALFTSLGIGCLSMVLALALAFGLSRLQLLLPGWRRVIMALGLAGFVVPPAVIATGWFLLFRGLDGGLPLAIGLVAGMNALVALPFTLAILAPAMEALEGQHDRLCAQLKLVGWQRFRLIDGPLLRKPLLLALAMAFVLSLGDLTAITLLGTQGLLTLPLLVQQQMGHYQTQAAGGTALVLGLICLALAALAQKVSA